MRAAVRPTAEWNRQAAARRRAGESPAARAQAPGSRARRRSLSPLWLGGLLLAGALFHVWSRLTVVDLGYRLAEARALHADLLERNRRLALDLAVLEAPARLAETAREKLGLLPPSPGQIVHMGRPGPATSGGPGGRSSFGAGGDTGGRTGAVR